MFLLSSWGFWGSERLSDLSELVLAELWAAKPVPKSSTSQLFLLDSRKTETFLSCFLQKTGLREKRAQGGGEGCGKGGDDRWGLETFASMDLPWLGEEHIGISPEAAVKMLWTFWWPLMRRCRAEPVSHGALAGTALVGSGRSGPWGCNKSDHP